MKSGLFFFLKYRADVKKETDDGKASARGGSGKQQQQKSILEIRYFICVSLCCLRMMMERKMAGAAALRQKREKEKEKEKERDSEREKEKPVASVPAREEVATKEDPKAEEVKIEKQMAPTDHYIYPFHVVR